MGVSRTRKRLRSESARWTAARDGLGGRRRGLCGGRDEGEWARRRVEVVLAAAARCWYRESTSWLVGSISSKVTTVWACRASPALGASRARGLLRREPFGFQAGWAKKRRRERPRYVFSGGAWVWVGCPKPQGVRHWPRCGVSGPVLHGAAERMDAHGKDWGGGAGGLEFEAGLRGLWRTAKG